MAGVNDVAAGVGIVVLVKSIISKKEKRKKKKEKKTYLGLEMSPGVVLVDGGRLSTRCCYALTCESVMVSVMISDSW